MHQTALKTTHLGQTGLEITRVGFGAWPIRPADIEEGWSALAELKEQGLVRHILPAASLELTCEDVAEIEGGVR